MRRIGLARLLRATRTSATTSTDWPAAPPKTRPWPITLCFKSWSNSKSRFTTFPGHNTILYDRRRSGSFRRRTSDLLGSGITGRCARCSTGSRLNLKSCLAPCGCLKTRSIRFGKVGICRRWQSLNGDIGRGRIDPEINTIGVYLEASRCFFF